MLLCECRRKCDLEWAVSKVSMGTAAEAGVWGTQEDDSCEEMLRHLRASVSKITGPKAGPVLHKT